LASPLAMKADMAEKFPLNLRCRDWTRLPPARDGGHETRKPPRGRSQPGGASQLAAPLGGARRTSNRARLNTVKAQLSKLSRLLSSLGLGAKKGPSSRGRAGASYYRGLMPMAGALLIRTRNARSYSSLPEQATRPKSGQLGTYLLRYLWNSRVPAVGLRSDASTAPA